ncbi:CCHC-type zinc finger nucleic acid binding protein-like [Microplitis demolitor]|uniref:CCHC-type zinc finger nucleic acid binding protein-like n=1 Tax=Microplitis demolitor TaxID=69319 RepID=UPI0004CD83BF|nr:CCHC-type zinc finger nucleic acid binding protein-like [Microplitis demolitor]
MEVTESGEAISSTNTARTTSTSGRDKRPRASSGEGRKEDAIGKRPRPSSSHGRDDKRRKMLLPPHLRPVCWNCKEKGHQYAECPKPHGEFCYGCGRVKKTLADCPECRTRWTRRGPYGWDAACRRTSESGHSGVGGRLTRECREGKCKNKTLISLI